MKWKKAKLSLILIILTFCSLFVQTPLMNLKNNALVKNYTTTDLHNSGVSEVTHTKDWIANGDFSSTENWSSSKGTSGDPNDVNAYIGGGQANYELLGYEDRFTFEEKYHMDSSWVKSNHPDFPVYPTYSNNVAGEGFRAEHSWDDHNANQVPSVQWELNFSLSVNMSDYSITSASVSAGVNASVDTNIDTVGDGIDSNTARSGGPAVDTYSVGDYIRFYVSISNLQKTKTYEIAYTQSDTLGYGNAGSTDTLAQQLMSTVSQADLIYYLSSVLDTDYRNFTLIVGIRFNCEDNIAADFDYDDFDRAVINSINLTFTYEKKIDQLTSVSWNQKGDKFSDITTNPLVINEAKLNFTYQVNDTFPKSLSPNSEIRIWINEFQHTETVKLWTAETTPQNASDNGFDVTGLIRLVDNDENINVSIELYIADNFGLNRTIKFSIDDIYLNITYIEDVTNMETRLKLFLDGMDMSNYPDPIISIPLGEKLNITVKYTNLTGDYIPSANIDLEGKVSGVFDPDPSLEQYNITINTDELGIGVTVLSVMAQKTFYDTNQTQFFVEVTERETELLLLLNGNPTDDGEIFNAQVDESVNVTVYFRDNETKQHLPDATVDLVGWDQLNETNGQYYNITINTNDLDQGINPFTIFAQLINYTTNSINFFIEIFDRETELLLLLNGDPKNDGDSIEVEIVDSINITVYYRDNITKQHLPNATVNLLNWDTLNETNNKYYNITIDAKDLDQTITILTIFAQKDNYKSQIIRFYIEVIERETELLLFLNGDLKSDGDTIQVEIDDQINITIFYRDNNTKVHLPNATVSLINWDTLNETNNQYYNITIDALDLNQGISSLTIFAQKANYQPKSIQFFIEVTERNTILQLFLNSEEKTLDPVFNLTIGEKLNITVKYLTQAELYVPNAVVQLLGDDISVNLTRDDVLHQHYIEIDTTELKFGVNLFSIIARSINFKIQTIKPIITINKIHTLINVTSQISAKPGDDAILEITLIDIDFGGTILNTTVTYKWAFGQGELVDLYNNGTYIGILENVPEGTYSIIITAFGIEKYDFETKEITLIVTKPTTEPGPDLTWLVYTLIGAIGSLVVLFTLYQTHFKYPPMVRKIRKLKKKVKKSKRIKPIIVDKRDEIISKEIQKQIKTVEYEMIQPEQVDKIEKVITKDGGEN
ncbi:MAG: hypothetical protein ACFFCE_09530 [Promethearchaeota archaeon]